MWIQLKWTFDTVLHGNIIDIALEANSTCINNCMLERCWNLSDTYLSTFVSKLKRHSSETQTAPKQIFPIRTEAAGRFFKLLNTLHECLFLGNAYILILKWAIMQNMKKQMKSYKPCIQ